MLFAGWPDQHCAGDRCCGRARAQAGYLDRVHAGRKSIEVGGRRRRDDPGRHEMAVFAGDSKAHCARRDSASRTRTGRGSPARR